MVLCFSSGARRKVVLDERLFLERPIKHDGVLLPHRERLAAEELVVEELVEELAEEELVVGWDHTPR